MRQGSRTRCTSLANRHADSTVKIGVEQVLEIFLLARAGLRFAKFSEDELVQFTETEPAFFDIAAVSRVKTRIAVGNEPLEFSVRANFAREFEREGVGIHAADM